MTNAGTFPWLFETLRANPARRRSLAYVAISLDGATEATHDAIRGAGSYRQVMSALSMCTASAIPFQIKMTIHARNEGEIEGMGMLAAQLGARDISFAVLQPTGTLHDESLFLSTKQWRLVKDRVVRVAALLKMPVVLAEGFLEERPFYLCGPFRGEQLHIDVRGRLSLCCSHADQPNAGREDEVAGDLHTVRLVDAHRKLLRIIHDAQDAKLEAIAAGEITEWDLSPCNFCMKHFGKPHWTSDGAAGPSAKRERWRGAWARDTQIARRDGREIADSDTKVRLRIFG